MQVGMSIVITFDEKHEMVLSKEQAEELYKELGNVLGKKTFNLDEYKKYEPIPFGKPYDPYKVPGITWLLTDNTADYSTKLLNRCACGAKEVNKNGGK